MRRFIGLAALALGIAFVPPASAQSAKKAKAKAPAAPAPTVADFAYEQIRVRRSWATRALYFIAWK